MKSIHPRKLITLRSKLTTSFFFVLLFSAYIYAFATPPGTPYNPGETLDPTCAPMSANCYVGMNSSQWTTSGSDIYYNTGKVGIGMSIPNGPLQVAELQYNAGTASQSGTIITGVGTTWTALMIGSEIVFADGSKAMIIDRSSNTSLTADISQSVSSQAYNIYYVGLTVNPGTGDVSIGSVRNPNSNSRLFVYGGSTGANIDARGNPGIFQDISQFEAEGNDYDTITNSISIRYFGSTATGSQTIMGYPSTRLGMLDFVGNDTSMIRSNTSIQFGGGVSDLVTMTLDPTNKRLGIGMVSPAFSLDVLSTVDNATRLRGTSGGGLILGAFPGSATFGAIWASNVSPTASNYTLATSGSSTLLNSTSTIDFSVSSSSVASISSGGAFRVNNLGAGSTRCVQASSTGVLSVTGAACASGTTSLSSLTAAGGSNSINNLGHNQTWSWDQTLSGTALKISHTDNSMTSGATLFEILSTGVGATGSNTYYNFKSTISKDNSPGTTTNIAAYFSATSGAVNYAGIFDQGNVGIGQTVPAFKLHIGSSSVVDGTVLLRLQDVNSTCDFNANAGAPTCGSDLTLKKDVTSLDNADLLNKVSNLNPVSYRWLTEESSANLQYGFIAQEVATQFPELVTDHTWIDGSTKKFLNMGGLMPYVVGAIKEMDIRVQGLLSLDTTNSNSLGSLIKQFLADVGNSIDVVFFGEVHTKKLCLEDVCVTKDQLQQMLNISNAGSGGGSGGGNPPPTPPTDVCPNIDGDQAEVPSGYHLEENNCVVDAVAPPPTDEGTPPNDNPPPADQPTQ